MKLGALLDLIRIELDDKEQPYLWSDAELIGYAEDAENEACRRASLIIDSRSPMCEIDVEPGEAEYDLDRRIIRVRRVRLVGQSRPLGFATTAQLDEEAAGWEDFEGLPSLAVTDWQTGAICLVPRPTEAGALQLRVVRLPLKPLTSRDQEPEIHPRFHQDLRHWIKKRAYEKPDSETQDLEQAAAAEAQFIAAFGPALSARTEEWNARNLPFDNRDGSE